MDIIDTKFLQKTNLNEIKVMSVFTMVYKRF